MNTDHRIADLEIFEVGSLGEPASRGQGRTLITPLDWLPGSGALHLSQRGDVAHQFVRITTHSGVEGFGIVGMFDGAARYVIDHHLRTLILGESAFDTNRIWEKLYRGTLAYGRRGMVVSAISAVDIALWDIKGRILGQPLYNLIGGRIERRIPLYASRLYHSDDIDEFRDEAKRYLDDGFRHMKMRFGFGPRDGINGIKENIRQLAALRDTVGDDVTIMADVYMAWDYPYFVQMRPHLAEQGLYFIEEPVSPDDVEGYAAIRRLANDAGILVAGGEHEATRWGIKGLLEARAVDIVQVDVNRAGGISEALRIWALASAYGVQVVPHGGQMHNYHLIASHLESPMAEHFPAPIGNPDRNEMFWRLWNGEPNVEDGYIELSDLPGLGIDPNWPVIEEYQIPAPVRPRQ